LKYIFRVQKQYKFVRVNSEFKIGEILFLSSWLTENCINHTRYRIA